MTTFQAVVHSILHGFAEFLPISASAHHSLIAYVLGWPAPEGAALGALALGAALSLLIYFRHDWASMISSFLQILIFRKRPMTLDERLPLFLTISTLPVVAAWYYLREPVLAHLSEPMWIAVSLAAFGIPLWLADTMSRRNKGMFDWNWLDALFVGITQTLTIVPGAGRATGAMIGALGRNYRREAAVKYAFFASAPLIGGSCFLHLRELDFGAAQPMEGMTWLTFAVTVVVTTLSGLLAIGGFMKAIDRKGFGQTAVYRLAVGVAMAAFVWARSRGML